MPSMSTGSVSPEDGGTPYNASERKQPRKRNRVPVACSVCRKRKVKCDRSRPHCEVCQRYNVAHLCFYQEPFWSQNNYKSSQSRRHPLESSRLATAEMTPDVNPDITITNGTQGTNLSVDNKTQNIEPQGSKSAGIAEAKLNRFENNINSLINHSGTTQSSLPDPKPFGYDDHALPFNGFRDINYSQSSERSAVNFPASGSSQVSSRPFPLSLADRQKRLPSVQAIMSNKTINDSDTSPVIQSELERMKAKIKEIEASITLSRTFASPANNSVTAGGNLDILSRHAYQASVGTPPGYTNESRFHSNPLNGAISLSNSSPVNGEPIIDPNEVINFYANYIPVHIRQSRVVNHGPLSWFTMLKRDRYLKIFWVKIIEFKRRKNIFPHNFIKKGKFEDDEDEEDGKEVTNSSDNNKNQVDGKGLEASRPALPDLEKQFRKRFLEADGIADMQPYKKADTKIIATGSDNSLHLGLSGETQSAEDSLIKKIEKYLPTKKVIWLSLDRYFQYVYPLAPYVDQGIFFEDICKIIGERSLEETRVESISVEKRLDFATIGLLLLLVRFGYLTTITNRESNCEGIAKSLGEDGAYLSKHPASPELAIIAQSCLSQFKLLRKTPLEIFQFALHMKLYHAYSPEEGEGSDSGNSVVFGGMLLRMGISTGLNRDPLPLGVNDKLVSLWRKLWSSLMISDCKQANILGNPPNIRWEHYDTEPAVFVGEKYANISNLELEKATVDALNLTQKWGLRLKVLSDMILNMKSPPKLITIFDGLKKLELEVAETFGSLQALMTPLSSSHIENFTKFKKIAIYLEVKMFFQVAYYHLFVHFEEKRDSLSAAYFLKKLLRVHVEMIAFFRPLLMKLYQYVGVGYDAFLTPMLEATMHRTLQIQMALIVRSQHYKCVATLANKLTPELTSTLDSFCAVMIRNSEKYMAGLAKLSHKYYHAWRMSKAQKFISDILRKSAAHFFEINKDSVIGVPCDFGERLVAPDYNVFQDFSLQDINDLADAIDPAKYLESLNSSAPSVSPLVDDGYDPENVLGDTDDDSVWFKLMTSSLRNEDMYGSPPKDDFFAEEIANGMSTAKLLNNELYFDQIFGEGNDNFLSEKTLTLVSDLGI